MQMMCTDEVRCDADDVHLDEKDKIALQAQFDSISWRPRSGA